MTKYIKQAILLPALLLFLNCVSGQTTANMTDYLSQRFLRYCTSVPREEIYIHSDKDTYISGEDMWFKIYLIDRQSFNLSASSRIVYFELLNADNRPIVQKRILIDEGTGQGRIVLPDTLSTGYYSVRAYTNWMKNFFPDNFYSRDVRVFNSFSAKVLKHREVSLPVAKSVVNGNNFNQQGGSNLRLRINNSLPDSLELGIKANSEYRSANSDLCYLFIQTHGKINLVSTEKIRGESTAIKLSKKLLGAGINQITIFNKKGEPVAERYIYTPRRGDEEFSVKSADTCGLRNKYTFSLEPGKDASGILNPAELSVSVLPVAGCKNFEGISDYLVFGTEFGTLPVIKMKGRTISDLLPSETDSILAHIRSNWIDWSSVLSDKRPDLRYPAEKLEHFLSGKLISAATQSPVSDENVLMCIPGKEASFQYARTGADGRFNFSLHIDESLKDIVILPDDISRKYKIIIETSFSDQYVSAVETTDSALIIKSPGISKMSVNHQVQTIFGVNSAVGPLASVYPPLAPVRFYGKPDIELKLADYISLPVMSEIFFELLPGVSMKQKKSGYEISVTEHIDDGLIVSSPVLMIDGVIVKDASLIANLDPEYVEKIDVVKGKYLVGKYLFTGIINVITKQGDFNNLTLPDYMIRLTYRVIDPVYSFSSPDYSSESVREDRTPDYRNTLYWNPSLKLTMERTQQAEFWSSDNKSDYIINIQGVTNDGRTVSIKKTFTVK
jgi:hypothetical protein